MTAKVSGTTATTSGVIVIGNPVQLDMTQTGHTLSLTWPNTIADTLSEESSALGSTAHWLWVTNAVIGSSNIVTLNVPATGNGFFRVRQPQ